MLKYEKYYSVQDGRRAISSDETKDILAGILGNAGVDGDKNPLKEDHCIVRRFSSGYVSYCRVKSVNDIIKFSVYNALDKTQDLYIAKNTYVHQANYFNEKTLFSLRNICIDVDNHYIDAPSVEICNTANIFVQDLKETHEAYGIPLPNAIVYTGRGIQSWYFIDSASVRLGFLSDMISEDLCGRFQEFLNDSPLTYDGFTVDYASSVRCNGLLRVPGSYNPAAKCFSQGKLFSDGRWDINDLKDELSIMVSNNRPMSRKEERSDAVISSNVNNTYAKNMISFLYHLTETGRFESREVICHIFHSLKLLYETEDIAAEETYALNELFTVPLRSREIDALIKCDNKHRYRYSKETILEKLDVPREEYDDYLEKKGLQKKHRDYLRENGTRNEARRKNRTAWHNEIRKFAELGYSITEISRLTGHDPRTVKKYMNTAMEIECP